MSRRSALRWSGERRRVALGVMLALTCIPGVLLGHVATAATGPAQAWLLFGFLFAVAIACPVEVWVAGRARRVTMVAAPLAAGLLVARPVDLVAGRVAAALAVAVVLRRRAPRRLVRELAVLLAGTGAALLVLRLFVLVVPGLADAVEGPGADPSVTAVQALSTWPLSAAPSSVVLLLALAVLVAVVSGAATEGTTVRVLQPVSAEVATPDQAGGGQAGGGQAGRDLPGGAGLRRWRRLLAAPRPSRPDGRRLERRAAQLTATLAAATVGLLAALAAPAGRGVMVMGLVGSVLLLGQRGLTSLADRQGSLERLYELSGALADAPTRGDIVGLALRRASELLRSGYAEVTLAETIPDAGDSRAVSWSLRRGHGVYGPQDCTAMMGAVASAGLPFPVPRPLGVRGGTPGGGAFLAARGVREALVVPLRVDGTLRGQLTVADPLHDVGGFGASDLRLLETVANHASIALRNARLLDRLSHEARHDELTGLPNRLRFRELLEETAQRAAAGEGRCSVMLIDFDGFKSINDTLGHQAGDDLLRVLASRLATVAGGDAVVARLGGDEFAVLSTGLVTAAEAEGLARRLLTVFDDPVAVAGTRLRVGGSLGIALGPRQGGTGSDLMRNADIAMYAAKRSGAGLRLYGEDLVESSALVLRLASDLPDAIAEDGIDVAVQPIVELAGGGLHSVEVLARWRHPDHGEVDPRHLFAAAERSGQVVALSLRILDRALLLSREWLDAGMPLQVCVNLAPRWLADPELPDQVAAALAHHGLAAWVLGLEITERSVIADPNRAMQTLARLRDLGVHLSVDDFGTGYSSLTYLSRLPVDQLKIDNTFVQSVVSNPRDQAIVGSIVHLGGSLGLEVVAEGVGDPETLAALLRMGCRLGQGYLFTRPLQPGVLKAFVAARTGAPGTGIGVPAPSGPLPQRPGGGGWARPPIRSRRA